MTTQEVLLTGQRRLNSDQIFMRCSQALMTVEMSIPAAVAADFEHTRLFERLKRVTR
jgi:hypothetical protein